MADERKPCFVISPIGDVGSPTRKRADQVMKHVIRPAPERCGYHAQRSDEISQPGIITNQIIQKLLEVPLVIADLTERNANVFYEVAIRHLVRKPLVQIIEVSEQIPFDLSASRMIKIDYRDLDSVEEARNALISQIHAVEQDPSLVDNPISVAIDLTTLRTTGKPAEVQLADLVEALASEMRAGFAEIKSAVHTHPPTLLSALTGIPGSASYLPGSGSSVFLGSPPVLTAVAPPPSEPPPHPTRRRIVERKAPLDK